MLRILVLIVFVFLNSCGKKTDHEFPILFVESFKIEKSSPITEISVRSRVVRKNNKIRNNEYFLEFDSNYEDKILHYKPSKLQINLPYVNAPSFIINLKYKDNKIYSDFNFPAGWIDSAELNGFFYIKNAVGWLIPVNSIYAPFGDLQYILKINEGKVVRVPISVIKLNENQAIVTGDVKGGDLLVNSRQGVILDGMKVRVKL